MKNYRRTFGQSLAATLCLGMLTASFFSPADVAGQTRRIHPRDRSNFFSTDPWWGFDEFGWSLQQLQRDRIASEEEMSREEGRSVRRDEVELQQEKEAAESVEYFESLIEASRAALRAPRGVYYRRPGFVSSDPPSTGAATVTVGGVPYLYERGIFLLVQGTQYVVVTAPLGAVVPSLPAGAYPVPTSDGVLHYFFGTFFREQEGRFAVVVPPPGSMVSYIPDGYSIDRSSGSVRYRFGDTTFKPLFSQGVLLYQVTAP